MPVKNYKYREEIFNQNGVKIIVISPTYLQPGSNILIKLETGIQTENLKAKFNGKTIPIFVKNNKLFCVFGVDVRNPAGIYKFLFLEKDKIVFTHSFIFGNLAAPKVDFGKEPKRTQGFLDKYYQERKIYNQIMEKTEPKILFQDYFSLPLEKMEITGTFGDQRTYNDTKNVRVHRGVDLRALTGTEVYAINDGKILMARNFTFEGNFIAIDHGGGIISFYMHLSEFRVKEGDFVKRGQLIGLSGSTGNSRNPHLHFALKVQQKTVDPLEFIELVNIFLFNTIGLQNKPIFI